MGSCEGPGRGRDTLNRHKQPVPLRSTQTVSEAFTTILGHNLAILGTWEQAARSSEDIEGVHQMRVAFRRMRSAISAFRSAVPREAADPWSEEMRWLAGQLGPARDLDVFIDEGLGAIRSKLPLPGADALAEIAELHRAAAYETVRAMLDSERFAAFKQTFPRWLDTQGWTGVPLSDKKRARLEGNIVPFARDLLDKQERAVLAAGSHVDRDSAREMHQLRIECKKLRYAAEFFTPLFAGMDEFIHHMKGLQDLLGVMNDVSVMAQLLEALLNGTQDPDVLRYAGALVGWRTRQYFEIKGTFDDRWDELVHAKHPWWRKSAVIE